MACLIAACTDVADPTRAIDPSSQSTFSDSSLSLKASREHKAHGDIAADPNSLTLKVGETFQLTTRAKAWGGKVTPKAIHFSSRDKSIATVDSKGLITAVGAGSLYIDVTADGDFVRYDPDKVLVKVTGAAKHDDDNGATKGGDSNTGGDVGKGDDSKSGGDVGKGDDSKSGDDAGKDQDSGTPKDTTSSSSTGGTTDSQTGGSNTGGSTGGTTTPPPNQPPPPPPPPPSHSNSSGAFANEPAGMTVLTNRAFDSKAATDRDRAGAEGWDPVEGRYPNFSVVNDPTAPYSGSSVGQMTYPGGMRAGVAPATAQIWFKQPYKTLYISMWVKLSSNFSGNQTSTNKIMHMWINGGNRLFLSAEGAFMRGLTPEVRLQGVPDARARILPNVKSGMQIQRGQWQHWELVLVANTPGQPNGIAQWWIDGSLVTDIRDLEITRAGESNLWQQFQWSPTFGGGGAGVPNTQYLWFDHVYVSGK
jgi:hypothetical protein